VQTLDGGHDASLQDDTVRETLHPQHTGLPLHQLGKHEPFEASIMRVHDVQRHLNGVERETGLVGHFQHVQVYVRILVAGKTDVAKLSRLSRLDQRGVCAFIVEDPMRVFEPKHLMVLHEVDTVDAKATKRFVQLSCGFGLRSAIDLRHHERFLAVAVLQRATHPDLARTVVVVPAVVEKIHAAVDGLANDAYTQRFIDMRETQVPSTETDRRYPFARSTQDPIRHFSIG
jgi:hypothetical protein